MRLAVSSTCKSILIALIVSFGLHEFIEQAIAADGLNPVRIADPVNGHIHPAVCLTEQGTLIVTYGRVNHHDLRITRSIDGGETWSPAVPFPPSENKTYYPGSLTTLSKGRILHAWNRWSEENNEKEPRSVLYSISNDEGLTWTDPVALPHDPEVPSIIRHPVVELAGGEWLIAVSDQTYLFDPETRTSRLFGNGKLGPMMPLVRTPRGTFVSGSGLRSTDEGKSWEEINPFPNLKEQWWRHELICLSNGWLLASEIPGPGVGGDLLRYVISYDDGRTWAHTFEYYNPGRPIGGRACPRTVQLDEEAIGVVFYDVDANQIGGPGLFFLRIPIAKLKQP